MFTKTEKLKLIKIIDRSKQCSFAEKIKFINNIKQTNKENDQNE